MGNQDSSGEREDVTAEVHADELDPLIGVTLDGRFRIVGALGKGAMGSVYRAVQEPLNRAVAIKVLDSNYGAGRDASFRQRFLVEAALTAKLQHPNTVRIIDYGCTADGIYYLAMEYLEGETLERLLTKGALPWRRAVAVAQQVARALREAHDLGVVHRDLKPGNVMLHSGDADADYVKVLDFGLVKSFVEGQDLEGRAVTQQGMMMGSPPYMAPEQGDSNRADPRSDLYSLGVVLFEMLSGRPPFTGTHPLEIVLKHVNDPLPQLAAPPGLEPLPDALTAVVQRCLAKSPMDRYQTMDELLKALGGLSPPPSQAVVEPVVAVSQPLLRPGVNPLVLGTGFVLALLAGVGLTALVMRPTPTAQGVTTPVPVAPPHEPDEKLAPPPTKLTFHVETDPPGASVIYLGKVVGVTPLDVPVNSTGQENTVLELTLKKEGYLPLTVKGGGSGPRVELSQKLQRLPPAQPPQVEKAVEKVPEKAPERPPERIPEKAPKGKHPGKKPPAAASKLGDDEDEPVSPPAPPKDELKRPGK